LGPSFPNHLYTIAAQSGGASQNPRQDFNAMIEAAQNGTKKSWGCDIAQPAYVEVLDSEGQVIHVQPCFDFETEGDLLRRADIPWAYYAADANQPRDMWADYRADANQLGYMWSAYSAIDRYRNNQELWNLYMRPVDDVVRDVEADR